MREPGLRLLTLKLNENVAADSRMQPRSKLAAGWTTDPPRMATTPQTSSIPISMVASAK